MSITIYAPATIANLGVGFDLLGAALAPVDGSLLGDVITVEKAGTGVELVCEGPWQHKLPPAGRDNIVYQCAEHFLQQFSATAGAGVKMRLQKNLPVGSGLGSSASSVVAALLAMNKLFAEPCEANRLLQMMAEFEGRVSGSIHYDNVAPCFMGGMQLLLQAPDRVCDSVPVFANWYWVVAYPGTSLSTAKMRALLPAQYDRAETIKYGRYLSGFIHAAYIRDQKLAIAMLHDVIAEPFRSPHIPGYEQARKAMAEQGMLACGISGSGPTIFAIADNQGVAQKAAQWLQEHYLSEPGGFVRVCKIDNSGARRV